MAVASVQVVLTRTAGLSAWKGGGFGMFATTDGLAFRRVRLTVDAPGRSEQLVVSPSLQEPAARASLFPSDGRLMALGRAVAARERRRGQPVATVRIEVATVDFDGDPLVATERTLRRFVYSVPASR